MTGDSFPPAPSRDLEATRGSSAARSTLASSPARDRRRGLALPLVSGLLGGVVGGLAVWLLTPGANDRTGAKPVSEAPAKPEPDGTAQRLEALEHQLASLRRAASTRQALAAYARAAEAQGDGEAGSTSSPSISPDSPAFEIAVRGVLDRLRAEQEAEQEARRWQRRQNRAKDLTALLSEELRLTELQQREVERILAEQDARYRELKRGSGDAGTQAAVTPRQKRKRNELIRKATEQATERALSEVLNGEQMRRFRQIRDEEELPPSD